MQEKKTVDSVKLHETFAGKYRLEEQLGEGAWGKIYRATHLIMKRDVAIKFLSLSLTHDENAVARFESEARIVSQLRHPNIISVFDFGVSDAGQPYFVMELAGGQSLADIVSEAPLSEQRALPIFMQICDALAAAHAMGVLHRDIKPQNIVISKEKDGTDVAMLVDFGLAKVMESEDKSLTATGETVGTPGYLSPEQYAGHKLTSAADIYSLGCVMYECLSGKPPFTGDSIVEIIKKTIERRPQPFRLACPQLRVSASVEHVVQRTLEKDIADRYQSAAKLKADLQRVLDGKADRVAMVIERTSRKLRRYSRQHSRLLIGLSVGLIAFCAIYPFVPLHSEIRYHFKFKPQTYPFALKIPPDYGFHQLANHSWFSAISESAELTLSNLGYARPQDCGLIYSLTMYMNSIHRGVDAEVLARKALQLSQLAHSPNVPSENMCQLQIARALAEQGKFEQAHKIARDVRQNVETTSGKGSSEYFSAVYSDGLAYGLQKQYEKSLDNFKEALAIGAVDASDHVSARMRYAIALSKAGHYQQACDELGKFLTSAQKAGKPFDVQWCLIEMSAAEQRAGHIEKALDLCRRIFEEQTGGIEPEPIFADCLSRCATMLRAKHCYANADELDKQAKELNKQNGRIQPALD